MVIHAKKSFKNIIKLLDIINPFLIILSIIGLFCEYTSLKEFVITPNKIISILFVVDFVIRFISFNPLEYFIKGYGWVDFIASLPGFFFFLNNTPLFAVFKIIKVGRFFKIIRILRFLRVFSFLKRMKSDSIWIQDRIMKIGITIVLVFVTGIILIDTQVSNSLTERESAIIEAIYNGVDKDVNQLLELRTDILYYTNDSVLYNRAGDIINDLRVISDLMSDDVENYIIVLLNNRVFETIENIILPTDGVIIKQGVIGIYQNRIMLTLLTTLLVILTLIIFYMGFVFAKDIQIVQLIIDSLDAGDTTLLVQEAEQYRNEDGDLDIDPDDNEFINLLKVVSKNSLNINSQDLITDLTGSILSASNTNNNIEELISNLEEKIDVNNKHLVEDTVNRLTPAIIKYIKKELKH